MLFVLLWVGGCLQRVFLGAELSREVFLFFLLITINTHSFTRVLDIWTFANFKNEQLYTLFPPTGISLSPSSTASHFTLRIDLTQMLVYYKCHHTRCQIMSFLYTRLDLTCFKNLLAHTTLYSKTLSIFSVCIFQHATYCANTHF